MKTARPTSTAAPPARPSRAASAPASDAKSARATTSAAPSTTGAATSNTAPASKPIDRLESVTTDWASAVGSRGGKRLEPFRTYYPEASHLPHLEDGKTLITFDEAQARCLHRLYWSVAPDMRFQELAELAARHPEFKERGEPITTSQLERFFKRLPESFPWSWEKRTYVASSYALCAAAMEAPENHVFNAVWERARARHPKLYDRKTMQDWTHDEWVRGEIPLPFLSMFERDARGHVTVGGLSPREEVQRKGDRLVLDEALGARVTALGRDPRVKYGWSVEQFAEFVSRELGGGFTFNTYESLRGVVPGVPSWTELKREAMGRLAALIIDLHETRHIVSTGEMSRVLHEEHGYELFPRTQYEYIRRYFPIPDFKAAKSEATRAEAARLATHLGRADTREHAEIARARAKDDARARYLLSVARGMDESLKPAETSSRRPYDARELALLRRACREVPIGSSSADVYAWVKKRDRAFADERQLKEPRSINAALATHLEITSMVEHEQRRLAELLARVAGKRPPPKSFAECVKRVRALHPIAYADESISALRREWSKVTPPHVAHLADVAGKLPWDTLGEPPWTAIVARLAAQCPGSAARPRAAAELTQRQAELLHELYWSAPPSVSSAEGLLALAQERSRSFAGVSLQQVHQAMRAAPESFPWPMAQRRVAIHAMLLAETLAALPKQVAISRVMARLGELYPGFPSPITLNELAGGLARERPELYPFLAALPRDADGRVLWERPGDEPKLAKGKVLILSEALAVRAREVCLADEVRWDWDATQLATHVAARLEVPVRKETLPELATRFPGVMPTYDEVMHAAGRRLLALAASLADDPAVMSRNDLLRLLRERHGYDLGLASLERLKTQHPGVLPDMREIVGRKVLAQAELYLQRIKENGGRDIQAVGRAMGLSDMEVKHRLKLIHDHWPDALATREMPKPYDDEDKKAMREAIDSAPLFAGADEVLRILNAQSSRFAERHPLASGVVFASAARRVLDHDWRAHNHERLRRIVVEVTSRSRVGYAVPELHEQIAHEHDVRLGLYQFRMLLADWAKDPAKYPDVAKLRRADGKLPWEYARTPLTRELAERLAAVWTKHPDWTLRQCSVELMRDKALLERYPNLGMGKLRALCARFRDVLPARGIREQAGTALKELGDRIRARLSTMGNTDGATPRWLATQLGVGEDDVLQAVRRAPSNFARWNPLLRAGVDLPLAAVIASTVESAPLGTTPEEIAARVSKDPVVRAEYGAVDTSLIARAAAQYPDLVPDLAQRERVLESKLLVDALRVAREGTPFAHVVTALRAAFPGYFKVDAPEPWIAQWQSNPAQYAFATQLQVSGRWLLVGQGKKASAISETNETLAGRLVRETREIPEELPLCRDIAKGAPRTAFEESEVLCVQHLLGGQVPFFELCRELGLARSRCTIVGVPYSTNPTVAEVLADKGWDVRDPPLDMQAWKEMVREALYERIKAAAANGRRVVVLDDGGHVADLLATDPALRDHAHLVSIVEQTRRGITVAERDELLTSLVNAAQSWGKVLEGHLIGDNLHVKLLARLARMGIKDVRGMEIGVVGNGVIGSPLVEELRAAGAIVRVRDKLDPDFDKPGSAEKFFKGLKLVVGATGHMSIGEREMALLDSGTIIASGTSKLVEIDVDTLKRWVRERGGRLEVIDDRSRPPTVRYHMQDGRYLDLMAQGFPLNFDGGVNNLDVQKVQLTHGLMLIGMLQAVRAKVAGFHHLELEQQRRLVRGFGRIDSVERDEELKRHVKLTELRIDEAKRGRGRADARAPTRPR